MPTYIANTTRLVLLFRCPMFLSKHYEKEMHKVFISYHHQNDQGYKEALVHFGKRQGIFIDRSVDTGNIPETLPAQAIREKIRDEYLRDSTVTVLLVGTETKRRKHIDWEIYSSMIDGKRSKKSGILVINLPSTNCTACFVSHGAEEKLIVHPDISPSDWSNFGRAEFNANFPFMPDRIIDNLSSGAMISVVPWAKLTAESLTCLLDVTYRDRTNYNYDFSRAMRQHNS